MDPDEATTIVNFKKTGVLPDGLTKTQQNNFIRKSKRFFLQLDNDTEQLYYTLLSGQTRRVIVGEVEKLKILTEYHGAGNTVFQLMI